MPPSSTGKFRLCVSHLPAARHVRAAVGGAMSEPGLNAQEARDLGARVLRGAGVEAGLAAKVAGCSGGE